MTNDTTRAREWCGAFFLALLFHVLIVLLLALARPFAPRMVMRTTPEPIDLVFAPASAQPPDRASPSLFTELPPDRAEAPPERPDFLSTVDSRARDMVPGGDDAMPRMDGESEAPHVRIDPGEDPVVSGQPADMAPVPPTPHEPASPPEATPPIAERSAEPGPLPSQPIDVERARPAERSRADPPTRLSPLMPPSPRLSPSRPGTDFHQVEMYRPQGNAAAVGSVSLNTVAWAYAPWLQEFSRRLQRSWLAPVAYYMGIIDGATELEMEVARDGSLLRLQVLDAKGHDSLRQTSVAVLEALAPYRPLPAEFPEPSLILRIKLMYPPLRGRG